MIYTLHVHQTMVKNQNYKWVLKSVAKNSTSDRYVEYPDKVIKELPVSGKICNLNPDMITHDFGRTIKKLGLPHFRFHDLRHYAATIMHAMGVPEAYIMERGSWKTNTVLNQVYRGTRSDFSKKYSDQANGYFENHLL
jgi:integrase